MYLRNRWYVAAWDKEVGNKPLARTIMNEPIVFFRDEFGKPVALEDSCAHRYMALSLGKVLNGVIQCPYHGLEYDKTGKCILIPGQTKVPPGSFIRSYPVLEKWRWIWIWMGNPNEADETLIPDFHWNDDPEWVAVGDYFYVRGNYRLLIDNLMDLTHVAYVHSNTLGTENVADFPVKVKRDACKVHVERWVLNEPAPPMFETIGEFNGPVDRWQLIHYLPPSHFVIDVGCATANTGALSGDRRKGITMFSNHTLTPENESAKHYFWHHERNFRRNESQLTETLANATKTAFGEDVSIIEMQQNRMDRARHKKPIIDINADAGVLQGRKLLDELIAAEN